MGLLTVVVNRSNYAKYMSLRNEKCMIQTSYINLSHI